ncbi:hypothetical protein N9D63_07295 [Opitutales bacterium]|nr:hypothetical protein [Opitutales bacterium]
MNSIDDLDLHWIPPRHYTLGDFSLKLFVRLRRDKKLSLNGQSP